MHTRRRTTGRRTSLGGIALAMTLAMTFALSACDLSRPYGVPEFPFLPGYASAGAGAPVLLSNETWWLGLSDPVLDQLVVQALSGNLTLDLAGERVVAARGARDSVPGAALLTSSADVGLGGEDGDARVQATAQAGLNWMLDPYGTRRGEMRAAGARIEIADAEVDAARLLVLFNVTNAYVRLRHDQRQMALAQAELRRRLDTLALTRTLEEAESATRLEITRTQARVAEVRSQMPQLEAAVAAGLNEIAVLTGVIPGTLAPDMTAALAQGTGQPLPGLSPDVGIPADLLRNRPDILIAERRYYAAVTEIGIARASLYPRLSLSGTISLNAVGGSGASADYYFGPSIQFPTLPDGAARAGVEVQVSEARQAHIAWMATVLGAILEVENALVEYNASAVALRSAEEASRLYAEAASLTRRVYREGEATLGDLIDAEQSLATAERTLADLRLEHALRFISLNIRLGAGYAAVPPRSRPHG